MTRIGRRPRAREWWLWVCPACGHYETEAGDYFTTTDGSCPVWKTGGALAHEPQWDTDENRPAWTPRMVRVRVYER